MHSQKNHFQGNQGAKSQLGHVSLRDSLMNQSRIVGTYPVVNHSNIVEKESLLKRHDSKKIVGKVTACKLQKTIGIFHSYPVGICNPTFTGMFL